VNAKKAKEQEMCITWNTDIEHLIGLSLWISSSVVTKLHPVATPRPRHKIVSKHRKHCWKNMRR